MIKYKNFKQFTNVFLFLASFLLFFFNVGFASAETTQYRSAGWVGTESESTGRAYTNVTGCQESDDGLYCLRPSSVGSGSSNLFFSAFGRLEDFNIPLNSVINRVLIRVKGRSSTSLAIGVINKYKHNSNSDLCRMKKSSDWVFLLGTNNDKIIEYNTSIAEQELGSCINENNINFHNLTFRIRGLSTSNWFAEIDNFEIAFDYTPPVVAPEPVEFPENQKGTVWEIGPDISNLKRVEGLSDVISVAAGYDHVLALKNDGTVWAWGKNNSGQLGNGKVENVSEVPVQVIAENGEGILSGVKQIVAGEKYSMALKHDGTLWVWGNNANGYRGVGFGTNDFNSKLLHPTKITSGHFKNISKISAGRDHSLALNSDGTLVGWGFNSNGQVGIGCTGCGAIRTPAKINGVSDLVDISGGRDHSLAVKADGTVWGWGSTSQYQLAKTATFSVSPGHSSHYLPVKIVELDNVLEVYSSLVSNYALGNNGEIFEWGGNIYLGVPRKVNGVISPKIAKIGFPSYSPGVNGHAIKDDGTLWELYINEIPAKQVPVLKNVTDVASGVSTPALAVINGSGDVLGDSTVAPFLRLPWDYEGQGRKFDDIVFDPESWFDHKYPLQNVPCCTFKVFKYTGQEVNDAYRSHSGYDYASRNGVSLNTPVLAAATGTATFKPEAKSKGAGNIIKIDHGNGYQTWYEHLALDELVVSDEVSSVEVERGQQIGKVGMTGATNGPHIHFSVFKDENENGTFDDDYPFGMVDPLGWDGEDADPWTEYESGGKRGAESIKLFTNLTSPFNQAIAKTGGQMSAKNIEVIFPDGALLSDIDLRYHDGPFESQSAKFRSVAPSFFLEAYNKLGEKITSFFKPVIVVYSYSDINLANIKEESLKIMHYNKTSKTWVELASEINTELKNITAETSDFSQFALMGEIKDSAAPVTEIILIGDSGEESAFRSSVSVRFAANDNEGGFGVKDTIYGINDEAWEEYLGTITVEDEGEYEISYQSADLVGNVEDIKSVEFVIDKTAPVSVFSIGGTEGENGWYVSNPTVTISASDNLSGIAKNEYSLNAGESYAAYKTPFEISTEGVNDLLYRAVDKAGNIENSREEEIKVDKTPPRSKIYISGSRGQENWYRSLVSLELSGSDEVSGYEGSFYSLDGGKSFLEYTDTMVFADEGAYEVAYYSIDIAGNKETEKVLVFNIDKTAPVVTLSVDPDMLWPPNGKMVSVRIGGSVTEENLLETAFGVSDEYGEVEPALSNFGQTIKLQARRNGNDPDGRVYAVKAVSEDLAGNEGSSEAKIVVPHDKRN